jgi:hypothetical protein
VDRGETEVTGDSDAQAVWTQDLVGRHFRASRAWYEIVAVTATPSLKLATKFAEDDVDEGTYSVAARVIALPDDVRWLGEVWFMRLYRQIPWRSMTWLNAAHAGRIEVHGAGPRVIVEIGEKDGQKQVELYPPCTSTEVLHYIYWSLPDKLGLRDYIPNSIDPEILKVGAGVDAYRMKMMNADDPTDRALWRNEMRAQQTVWNAKLGEAKHQDRGADDLSLLREKIGRQGGIGDVRTGFDYVFVNGNRP